jgi:hypothetical protein
MRTAMLAKLLKKKVKLTNDSPLQEGYCMSFAHVHLACACGFVPQLGTCANGSASDHGCANAYGSADGSESTKRGRVEIKSNRIITA